jgi:transposase-like protein
VRHPLKLSNVEGLLAERGINISYETIRFWWVGLARCLPLRSARGALRAHAWLHPIA